MATGTMEQLERALVNADKAGDTEGARMLAQEIIKLRQQAQPQAPQTPPQGHVPGMLDAFTQGASFGWGDELTGTEAAILGKTPEGGIFDYSKPYDERYQRAVDAERGQQAAYSEANPIKAGVAEVAGAVTGPLAAARTGATLMRGGLTLPQMIGRGTVEGAIYGSTQGAGDANGGDRLEGAATGGLVGGTVGAGGSAAIGQISRILANRGAAAAGPTWRGVRSKADAFYKRARDINPQFEGFDKWVMDAYQSMPEAGYHPNLHPQLSTVLDRIEELSRNGTAPPLKDLEQLRRLIGTPASTFGNPDQQRLAKTLRGSLDKFMEGAADRIPGNQLVPADMSVIATPQRDALNAVREGRSLYRRSKNGELIDTMFRRAEDRAGSTNSGANVENTIRQNMRRILDSPKLSATFNAEELDAIRKVVRGEPLQNVMRKLGSMSPLRGGLMSALMSAGTGAGVVGMGPVALIPAGVTAAADALAKAGTRSQARAAQAMVLGGPKAAAATTRIPYDPRIQAIIDALAAQSGGATAPGAPR